MELTYTKHGDYYIPDLDIPAQEKVSVNRYGQMHGNYLRKNNRTAYNELLFSGRLNQYLAEIGEQAEKMLALLTEQYEAGGGRKFQFTCPSRSTTVSRAYSAKQAQFQFTCPSRSTTTT